MNLKETIDKLNSIAISQPNVNDYVKSGNIYDLSENRNANFSVFCVTQGTHSYDFKNGYNIFNFVLYYVDRLTSDGSNKIEIQSTAIETLKNIIRAYCKETDVDITTADFEVFTESFSQLCAGAYTTISIIVEDTNCLDEF